MIKQQISSGWQMRDVTKDEWYNAIVPGSVYKDLLENNLMEDPFYRDNEDKTLELMKKDYEYKTSFIFDSTTKNYDKIILHFDGIDTISDIYLNGEHLGYTENMYRIWEYDITSNIRVGENELRVILHSPTKFIKEAYENCVSDGSRDAMKGFPHLRKAHCMFGWDWGARLPDAGIFREVSLLLVNQDAVDSVLIRQIHEDNKVTLKLEVDTKFKELKTEYDVQIITPTGESIEYFDSPKKIVIDNPSLWYPNGYGKQDLYTIRVILKKENKEIDTWERRIGLRTTTIRREKDEYGESFTHVVNNIPIFAMGADYIPEDHIISRVTKEKTLRLLTDAKDCNFNVIRVWGGGYYPDDYFYDICDELGLLVWQDFMFACAVYELTEEFEANIVAEFIDNIKRIRHHASLSLWCGNNEMEMFISEDKDKEWIKRPKQKTDYINMYEYILPKVLKKYDPDTFYWPASPSSGGGFDEPNDENRGDVHYWKVWHGDVPFTEYRKYYFRYISEFGFQSFPTLKTIESFTLEEDRNIFSYVMEKHQKNDSANGKIMNYMSQTYRYPTNFAVLLYASQMLQAEAIRYGVEHFRRNRGRCMGTVYWQLNDCWPVASWSSIDYFGRWKALQYYAKRFFAPVLLSCEEEGMLSDCPNINEEVKEIPKRATLYITNDTNESKEYTVKWSLRKNDSTIIEEKSVLAVTTPYNVTKLESVSFPEADIFSEYFAYELLENEEIISSGTEIFSVPKYFKFIKPNLSVSVDGDTIVVESDVYTKGVEILNENEDMVLSDNYFDMNAGKRIIKILRGNAQGLKVRSVYDIR